VQHLANLALVVGVHVEDGELAHVPWDVPETNAADIGFV